MGRQPCWDSKVHRWIEVSIGGLPHWQCTSCGTTKPVPLTIWAGGGYVLPDWSAPHD